MEEDVWNAACVSAGAEEGRRPVAESGRGDGSSDCATDTELFIGAGGRAETDPGVSLWVAPRRLGRVTSGEGRGVRVSV